MKEVIPKLAGIYKIINIVNGKFYIGSTKNLRYRWTSHKCLLNNAKKGNSKLKAAWIKYGTINFKFEVIAECPEEYLIDSEQWYIDNLKPHYNTRIIVCKNNTGMRHTENSLEKISNASKNYHKNNPRYLAELNKKPILCYNKNGDFVKEYDSAKSAADDLDMFSTNITSILKGKNYLNNGYHFKYKVSEEIQTTIIVPHKKSDIEISVIIEATEIGKFKNVDQAHRELREKGYTIGEYTLRNLLLGKYKGIQYSNWKVTRIN
jgi:hypothetical protein